MHKQISSGTIDSPSWDLVRTAKLAARIYAPLGTRMSLGDHIRVVRAFLDAFKDTGDPSGGSGTSSVKEDAEVSNEHSTLIDLRRDLKVRGFLFTYLFPELHEISDIPRPTCPLGYQRRPHPKTTPSSYHCVSNSHPSYLVSLPVLHLPAWPPAMAPSVRHYLLRCPQLQKEWTNMGYLG
jgi:hypothetical protein